MSREAMQQALEALEILTDGYDGTEVGVEIEAITALRQALKTEQKPVAWANTLDFDDDDIEIIPAKAKGKLGSSNCDIPLYTAPPKREWVGLTDQEIEDLWNQHERRFDFYSFSCDIEAKLKEKNHG